MVVPLIGPAASSLGTLGSSLGLGKVAGGGGGGGKSGRKERNTAYEMSQNAMHEYDPAMRAFLGNFGSYLGGETGVGGTLAGGQAAMGDLMAAIQNAVGIVSDPSKPMPFGLSAPGILDNLVARGQEVSQQGAQTSARSMANMMPTMGGSAQRAISDIYQGSAGDQANMETNLRAQAAQQDLQNRMGYLNSLTSAGQGVGGMMQGAMFPTMNMLDFLYQIADRRSSIQQGLSAEYYKQARDTKNSRNAGYMAMGQGIGELLGKGIGAAKGAAGAAGGGGGK